MDNGFVIRIRKNQRRIPYLMSKLVHVAVAAIVNDQNEVLISCRADDVHQGGLWEFPGGKIEPEETVTDALKRELYEELDITATDFSPLIKIHHDYPDKLVLLDVWRVIRYEGTPKGKEGQPLKWTSISSLDAAQFPVANKAIITAIRLPDELMITGQFDSLDDLIQRAKTAITAGIRIIQFRAHHLTDKAYIECGVALSEVCRSEGVMLILNRYPDMLQYIEADGAHLSSQLLREHTHRNMATDKLLSASCHNLEEIQQAIALSVDYCLLSPVLKTGSHPETKPLGWRDFSKLVSESPIPIYALGGVGDKESRILAKQYGGQGVAAISAYWPQTI